MKFYYTFVVEMDITYYIKLLLLDYDCVIVPHFGGFLCNYVSARIEKESATLCPPRRIVSFNRNLTQNDGLLVGKVSESESLSYDEAQSVVEKFVSSVKTSLDMGERVSFDEIGSFSLNKEGSIQFEPCSTFNYNLDAFGLTSFKFEPISKGNFDIKPATVEVVDADENEEHRIRKILLRSAAVVIPAALLVGAFFFHNNSSTLRPEKSTLYPIHKIEKTVSSVAEVSDKDSVENSEAVISAFATTIDTINEKVTSVISNSEAAVKSVATESTSRSKIYSVVLGSFQVEENAIYLSQLLQERGFETFVSGSNNGFYRVEVGKYPSVEIAAEQRATMIAEYPGAWVKRVL